MGRKVVLNVTPDRLDLRDRPYLPGVALAPPASLTAAPRPQAMDGGFDEDAATLRSVIEGLR